ncbi:prolyl oligopeptidase family protein (macronuclear) [Tetrahymena thermophila SB210]|uniref:acylaminoacyl-peptidase n=1 Tax=Tetrahymena thermophila (strain SB210) TaxID=312017 RepID=Q239B4_TETTS|nr:prolyl oligopeptidase family protein [Tetrahymena thermophila SB210]EAR93056.2 prolyl oligopeptidase family protein [Tetrahymena thermophila SB210]|eukprot:XP_001013301.2 prolyl oligopeptidase family protein [Tetrahymena thermophila SB210]
MDSKRLKLLTKFLERVFQSSHSINSVEMISDKTVKVNWAQHNIRDSVTYNYSNLYDFDQNKREIGKKLNDFPIQVQKNISVYSPERSLKAVIQSVQDKTKTKNFSVIEIYKGEDIVSQVNLQEMHEKILDDPIVGNAIVWNKKETKFLYIAQVKAKPTKNYFEVEEDKDLDDVNRTYNLDSDFGEGMNGITKAHLFEYNIESQTLSQIEIPENIFPSNPQYLDESGESIILQGYKLHPEFRYGILHCFNRQSDIFLLQNLNRNQLYPKPAKNSSDAKNDTASDEKKQLNFKVISQDEVSFKPMVSPDGQKIAYFGAPLSPPHLNYMGMKIINTQDWSIEEIIPIRKENLTESGEFMGICGFYDDLKNFFWLKDSIHFVLTTIVGHSLGTFLVNSKTKQIRRFAVNKTESDEFQVIDYNNKFNTLFATHTNMAGPPQLAFLKNLDLSKGLDEIVQSADWQYITLSQGSSSIFPSLQEFALKYFEEQVIRSGESTACLWRIKQFDKEFIPKELKELYENNDKLNPLNNSDQDRPLIVFIHGGPHSSSTGLFAISHLYFLLQGYTILLPNYTGSAGYGQNYINKLLKNIGEIDAKEILNMIDQVIEKKLCDPKKAITMGGSYGGYMTGILSTRYHERFICAVMRNPVVNIPYLLNATDIPDWCLAECFGKKMTWNLTGEDYKTMFEFSPMSQPNKLPILNLLGAKDRRVPYQQSIAYHAQSIYNGTEIETYIYPESDHALRESLPTIVDSLIKQISFLEKHLLK